MVALHVMPNFTLDVYAPIPRGHRVRLCELQIGKAGLLSRPMRVTAAIDLTTAVHYLPYVLLREIERWGAADGLARALSGPGWSIVRRVEGEVELAAVLAKDSGECNAVHTRLFLRPAGLLDVRDLGPAALAEALRVP